MLTFFRILFEKVSIVYCYYSVKKEYKRSIWGMSQFSRLCPIPHAEEERKDSIMYGRASIPAAGRDAQAVCARYISWLDDT
jgi:hypothetical protein